MASQDLLLRITGDSSSAERALMRAEAAQRKYDLTVRRAQSEMAASFKKSAAEQESALRRQSAAYGKAGTAFLSIGTVAAVGLGAAAKAAMDWESSWAGVTKTVDGSDAAMAELEQGLRDLALVLPASQQEIAAVAEAAGALGVSQGAILGFTETMINLGETTNVSAEQAATSIAQIQNILGFTDAEVENFASTLVGLGNAGASTEADILALANRLSAAGKAAGFSTEDILGIASAMSSLGIEAEAGGTAFSKVFQTMNDSVIDGNENLATFAEVAGVSTEEFARAFRDDAGTALALFVEGLGEMSRSGESTTATLESLGFADARLRASLTATASQQGFLTENLDLASAAWEQNNALAEEAAKRYETTEAKVQLARNALVDAGIDIGASVLPVLADLASGAASVLDAFTNLPGPVKTGVTALGGLVATGGLVIGAGLKISSGISNMNVAMKDTPRLATAASVGLKAMGAVGIAAGIAASAVAIEQLWLAIEGDVLDSSGLEGDLLRLGTTGKATGQLLSTFGGDLSDLGPVMEDAARGFDLAIGSFGKEAGIQSIENLDAALANLQSSGQAVDMEAAAAAFAVIEEAAYGAGLETSDLNELFPLFWQEMDRTAVSAEGAADKQTDLGNAIGDVAVATADATPAQEALAEQMGLSADNAVGASEAVDAFRDSLSRLYDQVYGVQNAQDDLQTSLNDLVAEVTAADEAFVNGEEGALAFDRSLQGTSQAAIDNRETLEQMVRELGAVAEQNIINGDSQAEVTDKYNQGRDALVDQMVQLGFTREEVEALTLSQGEVQELVETLFEQPGMQISQENTKTLTTLINGVPNSKTVTIAANTGSAQMSIDYLKRSIDALQDRTVTIYERTVRTSVNGSGGNLPGYGAKGGLAKTATNMIIGEAGPEALIPLDTLDRYLNDAWSAGMSAAERGAMAGTRAIPVSSSVGGSGLGGSASIAGSAGPQPASGSTTVNLFNPVARSVADSVSEAYDVLKALA